jgi:hypothetical protein
MLRSLWTLVVAAVLAPLLLFAAGAAWSYWRVEDEASTEILRTVDLLHEQGLRFFETESFLLQSVDTELSDLSWPEIDARKDNFDALLVRAAAQLPEKRD